MWTDIFSYSFLNPAVRNDEINNYLRRSDFDAHVLGVHELPLASSSEIGEHGDKGNGKRQSPKYTSHPGKPLNLGAEKKCTYCGGEVANKTIFKSIQIAEKNCTKGEGRILFVLQIKSNGRG